MRAFPETFSFHVERHDPAELYLQLEDLWTKPGVIAANANRRDAELVVQRLFLALPGYLESLVARLEGEGHREDEAIARVYGDVATLIQVVGRFMADKGLDRRDRLQVAALHLRKLAHHVLRGLLRCRVRPAYLDAYVAGEAEPLARDDDLSESAFAHALVADPDTVERYVTGMAENAFFAWVEGVCLDDPAVFGSEESPFASREVEVLEAMVAQGSADLIRARDYAPFLRRARNRDALRVLNKLERFFLHQYDIRHAAAVNHHMSRMARGEGDNRRLTLHSPRSYALALVALLLPFLGAAFAYERAPLLFDVVCSLEVLVVTLGTFWFLLWRFYWKHDLTSFRAAVPRVTAGIIVGYLPVFLIDEVWDLARRDWFPLGVIMTLLGFVTLLYLFVEVQRRLEDAKEAFARARALFALGLIEAFCMGLIVTSLLGRYMVVRNWGEEGAGTTVEWLRATTPAVVGELPRIVGLEPVLAYPTVVLLMTFLSFFIGTFLQLMWEDLPITEPL